MADIKSEIAAFEAAQSALEASHLGKWVLFHDAELINVYNDFDEVAAEAVRRFGRGPYLIRQVAARATLPASVVYGPLYERK